MPLWPWADHVFSFEYPVEKYPEVVERVRGLPVRVAELVSGVQTDKLVVRDGKGWSIQENVGHLVDVHILMFLRLDDFMAGAEVLTPPRPADLPRPTEHHNDRPLSEVLADLGDNRGRFVMRLEELSIADWGRTALHPRLNQQMRLVDHAFFFAEHDDYHMARMRELSRAV